MGSLVILTGVIPPCLSLAILRDSSMGLPCIAMFAECHVDAGVGTEKPFSHSSHRTAPPELKIESLPRVRSGFRDMRELRRKHVCSFQMHLKDGLTPSALTQRPL